jgi:hypothetical protein
MSENWIVMAVGGLFALVLGRSAIIAIWPESEAARGSASSNSASWIAPATATETIAGGTAAATRFIPAIASALSRRISSSSDWKST